MFLCRISFLYCRLANSVKILKWRSGSWERAVRRCTSTEQHLFRTINKQLLKKTKPNRSLFERLPRWASQRFESWSQILWPAMVIVFRKLVPWLATNSIIEFNSPSGLQRSDTSRDTVEKLAFLAFRLNRLIDSRPQNLVLI